MSSTPASVEELTPDWFSTVLGTDVGRVEVLDAHSGTTGRARVGIDGDGVPSSLFVKLQPFDADQRAFLQMIGLGTAEAILYSAEGNRLPVRVPRTWHSEADPDAGTFVMVLEDLEAAGCTFPTAEDDDVLDVAGSLMDELAALHATYWGRDLPWLGRHALSPGQGKEHDERRAMGASIVQTAIDEVGADMLPEFRALGELYIARHGDIDPLFGEGERTLVHGDCHIGNLFVDDGRTGFYDWAVASPWPGMRDVAYFLCNSLPTDVRREEEDTLIARYRTGLAERGVTLDDELAQAQYRTFAVTSWISAATTLAMGSKWQPVEVGRRATVRTTQAIADLGVLDHLHDRLD